MTPNRSVSMPGVSVRTVRRDIEQLRELGYRVTAAMGPQGGYRLEAGAELPPLLFDDEQAVALAVALRTAAASGVGTGDAAGRALATVRQLLPSRLRHRVDALEVTALPAAGGAPQPEVAPEVLLAVSDAVRRREVLRFDYGAEDGPARQAEAHHVVTTAGRWYLVAWDLERGDWRTFRLDCLRPRQRTGIPYGPRAVPGGDVAAFVAASFRGGSAQWPCRGAATLGRPAHEVAPFVGDGVVEAVDDNRCRVTLGSWSWVGLAASLARFGATIDDVAPAELADAFTVLAERFAHAGRHR